MTKIPQSVIDAVSSRVSLADVASGHLTLERRGGRLWGLCPFHDEKTPSFSVSEGDNLFYCFGCGRGGNLYAFVQEIEGLSFPEAVRQLAERAGIEVPAEETAESSRRSALIELYSRVAGSLHYYLAHRSDADRARVYLRERGVSQESIDSFQIGYAPKDRQWLFRFLSKRNYSREFLASTGLFSRKYDTSSFFSDRIVFPIRGRDGSTIAFGGRAVGNAEPKYLNSPDTEIFSKKRSLYGIDLAVPAIRKERRFVLTEGYLDVIALHQAGVDGAVAPLGTSFTEEQVAVLRRQATDALLLFDGDEAGLAAAEKAVASCEKAGIESSVAIMPRGSDPGDVMHTGDYETLKNVLQNGSKGFTFVVNQTKQKFDPRGAEGKASALRHLLPFVNAADSEVRKQTFLDEIADALQVDASAVRADYRRFGAGERLYPSSDSRQDSISSELFLMLAVSSNISTYEYVRTQLTADDIQESSAKQICVALEECFREGEASLDALLARISDHELRRLIVEKSSRNEFVGSGDRIVRDSVKRVKEKALLRRRSDLGSRLRHHERETNASVELRDLLEEKMWIDAELLKLKDDGYE